MMDGTINFDSFINLAIKIGLVNEVAFCCNNGLIHSQYGRFINYESPTTLVDILEKYKNDDQKLSDVHTEMCNRIIKERIILDIDLDFF